MKRSWLVGLTVLPLLLSAQKIQISGAVRNEHGDGIPMASMFVIPDSVVISTDAAGKFLHFLSGGVKSFRIFYTGYDKLNSTFVLGADTAVVFTLTEKVNELKEVVVESDRFSYEDVLESIRSGTNTITQKDVERIPVFLGEADPIKAVQLLPGVVRGVEGTSDVFVRGGAADQNLVLLDGAPVYNTGHLFGFLSVFNPDVVDKVEVITGGFPAEYGGRLSSVLDVATQSAIAGKTSASVELGVIGTRMKFEQPVIKDKASFWIAGRRSYIDRVAKAFDKRIPYYFYDLNGKFVYHPTKSDEIEASHFIGSDRMSLFSDSDNDGIGMLTQFHASNSTQSLRWNHASSSKWKNDLSLFQTRYNYNMKNVYEEYALFGGSDVFDRGARLSVKSDSLVKGYSLQAGLEWIHHEVQPSIVNATGRMTQVVEQGGPSNKKYVHEIATYAQAERAISDDLRANLGLRTSMALAGDKKYIFPEPRFSLRYALAANNAIKFSYSRMVQYMHRISNSAVATPVDIWSPVTDSLRPQRSHQFSVAWQRFLSNHRVYFSVESYYKSMNGLVGYKEGTNLLFNADYAKSLIQGRGRAYGFEFLVRKDAGKFTGWISYSLSWSWRKFSEINNGDWFHARYDRRHNGAVVGQYQLSKRWAASMVWEFISGARFTPMTGQYVTGAINMSGVEVIPVYADVNSAKLSDAHRLDLGIKFFSKPGSKFQWNWFAGIYNVYNRATPIAVVAERDARTKAVHYKQPGLFGLLPFVSYGCKI